MNTISTLIATATLMAATNLASAAFVVSYRSTSDTNSPTLAPFDWVDNIGTPSALGPAAGSTVVRTDGGGLFLYAGWGSSIDMTKYAGFTVTADSGHQLNLTDLAFSVSASRATSYLLAYRVNEGSGFGDWVQGTVFTASSPDFTNSFDSSTGGLKVWNFDDFSTTGTVEFGIFATATTTGRAVQVLGSNMELNGTVSAVPEPSAALLGALGGLAFFRRRR